MTIVLRHWSDALHVLPLLTSTQLFVQYFLLLSCWAESLDILCLNGVGIDDWIAVGAMLRAALGITHSHDSWQSHIRKEAVKAAPLSVSREDLANFLVKR